MPLKAASVSLAWDPPETFTDGTPITDLSGYRLYHGLSSGVYTEHVDVSNSTTVTFLGLQSGCSNFFSVTAVNGSGAESDFSKEIVLFVPPAILMGTNAISVQEGASSTFQVRLDAQPVNMTTVLVSRVSGGNRCLGAVSGAVLVFSPSNWAINQTVTVAALYDLVKTNRTATFQLSGAGLSSATISVTSLGAVQGVTKFEDGKDTDANGIPDAWEIIRFGGVGIQGASADDDLDRDGESNIQEFIAGTDPADPESRPLVDIRTIDGRVEVSFQALEAAGFGYLGKSRFYTLEQCTNLTQGVWGGVSSATEILAHNQTFSYSEVPLAMRDCYYRVRIHLQ